jgi:urea carboxylase
MQGAVQLPRPGRARGAGSTLLETEEAAVKEAAAAGYPVLLKATGGGGGIGIYQCPDEDAVRANFAAAGRCAGQRVG